MPLPIRSEEHTSELQSHDNLVCRLLLEKKKTSDDFAASGITHSTAWTEGTRGRARRWWRFREHVAFWRRGMALVLEDASSFFLNNTATPESSSFSLPRAPPI